jgi:hypothetical protein
MVGNELNYRSSRFDFRFEKEIHLAITGRLFGTKEKKRVKYEEVA